MGINESLEVIKLFQTIASAIEKARDDGDIDWMDLPKFAPVILEAKRAVDGSHLIPEELQDLSAEEAQLLATAAINAGLALVKAVTKK